MFKQPEAPHFQPNSFYDEDFIKVFEPFVKIQIILGSSRVNVKNGSFTKPTKFQKCFTTICVTTMIFSLLQLIMSYTVRFSDDRKLLYLWIAGIAAVLVVFSGEIIYTRFYDNEGNIHLYIKLQEIDRLMGSNQTINTKLHKRNRKAAYILSIFFAVILVLSYFLARNEFSILELVGATYTLETSVLELACCANHINFFYTRVVQLNSHIRKYALRKPHSISVLNSGEHSMKKSAEWQKFDAADIHLKEIYKGFMLFREQYRFQIFLFCVVFVIWIAFTFEHGVLALQSGHTDKAMFLFDFLFLLSLVLIDLLLLLMLSAGTEAYIREVRKSKHLCLLIMCRNDDGPLRRKAKIVVKLIEQTPPRFSVYGMWCIDAKLLIDIFNVITNFILAIIQLTYL